MFNVRNEKLIKIMFPLISLFFSLYPEKFAVNFLFCEWFIRGSFLTADALRRDGRGGNIVFEGRKGERGCWGMRGRRLEFWRVKCAATRCGETGEFPLHPQHPLSSPSRSSTFSQPILDSSLYISKLISYSFFFNCFLHKNLFK